MSEVAFSQDVWLLARTYTHYASRYLNGYGTSQNHLFALMLLACVVLVWILLLNWERIVASLSEPPEQIDPLLWELCQAHKLSRGELQVLARFAEELKLAHPAELFVLPALWTARLAAESREASRLRKLYKLVFGTDFEMPNALPS